MLVRLFYSDTFVLPLPDGHRFPMDKYRRLRERLFASGRFEPEQFCLPPRASDTALLRVHDEGYLAAVCAGSLAKRDARRIGFPWSPRMVERSRRSVGATLAAADSALVSGVGVNLAGGTHHAFADRGGGYCVFNDIAVTAAHLLARGIEPIVVIDLDVHQGDGTAELFRGDDRVFSFSMHGARNYPARKMQSDLDIALPDQTTEHNYLPRLQAALQDILDGVRPRFAFYQAGADPFAGDRLGRLALSKEGLRKRDEMVLTALSERAIPTAVLMGGGYADSIDDIVDIHAQTVFCAQASGLGRPNGRARPVRAG